MLSTNSKNNLVLLVDCKNTTPTGSTMTQTVTDGKTGPRENPQFCAALEQQLSLKKGAIMCCPQEDDFNKCCSRQDKAFCAAHEQQDPFHAAKKMRKEKEFEILTAWSNAAVQGQRH